MDGFYGVSEAIDQDLSASWVFKGGTCLKKCFLETYRFSEDLDFTVMPGGPIHPDEVNEVIGRVLSHVVIESGIDFFVRAPSFRERDTPLSTEGHIYFRGPRGAATPASIKIDLNGQEKVVRPRDLYDIVNLFRRQDIHSAAELICSVLIEKCNSKGVPVPTFATLETSPYRGELKSEWENMLSHQLPVLE